MQQDERHRDQLDLGGLIRAFEYAVSGVILAVATAAAILLREQPTWVAALPMFAAIGVIGWLFRVRVAMAGAMIAAAAFEYVILPIDLSDLRWLLLFVIVAVVMGTLPGYLARHPRT
jgi:hypothetical protein